MASGTIKFKGVGNITNITLPFTAPTDGYFYAAINPQSTAQAYVNCLINGNLRISVISTAGARNSNGYLVKKGDVITIEGSANAKEIKYTFRPIYF